MREGGGGSALGGHYGDSRKEKRDLFVSILRFFYSSIIRFYSIQSSFPNRNGLLVSVGGENLAVPSQPTTPYDITRKGVAKPENYDWDSRSSIGFWNFSFSTIQFFFILTSFLRFPSHMFQLVPEIINSFLKSQGESVVVQKYLP